MLDLSTLKKIGAVERFGIDESVFLQGEKGDSMYIVLQGSIAVIVNSEFDGTENQLAVLKSGDFFGEMSLIQDEVRMASVRTLENAALFKIGKDKFEEFISKEPKMIHSMLQMLSKRIIKVEHLIDEKCKSEKCKDDEVYYDE